MGRQFIKAESEMENARYLLAGDPKIEQEAPVAVVLGG